MFLQGKQLHQMFTSGSVSPMHGAGSGFYGNGSQLFSPVTFSHEWPTLGRLLFMVICSCIGTTLNGFFVAAFFVERTLKKIGNVYLACIGLADLIVTTAMMPVSAVVLLSAGEWDTLQVCHVLHFLGQAATYSYSLFFALVAAETFYRLCRPTEEYEMFISMRIGLISVLVFVVSLITSAIGVYINFDYDYCQRLHFGDFYFRTITFVIFHIIPSIMTLFGLICSCLQVRKRAQEQICYKRSQQYERDFSTTNLNIVTYILFVTLWTPYLVVVHEYPGTSDTKYYHCVWIGLCRSIFTNFLYTTMNRNFRRAFAHLFYYCCCKSTLSGSFSSRHRRALEYKSGTGDVRVHIMHQVVNSNSPQRASSSRETQEL